MQNKELTEVKNEVVDIQTPVVDLTMVAEQAERRIEAIKKIKNIVLRITNPNDWVDQNGVPYLQASGAEKVARLFGISWRINDPIYTEFEDGHFEYTYKGEFSLGGATIEAIGRRSSKDPFFSTRYDKSGNRITLPPSEIDKGDVKMAAYTNLLGNGIKRLLGIRNLTYEDLKEVGITKEMITKFAYKDKKKKGGDDKITPAQKRKLFYDLSQKGLSADEAKSFWDFHDIKTKAQISDIIDNLDDAVKEWKNAKQETPNMFEEGA